MRRIVEKGDGPLPADSLRAIYREIMSASLALEKPLVIAYLGPEATYSHMAVIKKFGSSLKHEPLPSITDVFTEVSKGRADYGGCRTEDAGKDPRGRRERERVDDPADEDLLPEGHPTIVLP